VDQEPALTCGGREGGREKMGSTEDQKELDATELWGTGGVGLGKP